MSFFGRLSVVAAMLVSFSTNAYADQQTVLTGTVTAITLAWHRKSVEELKEAYGELRRPRVGRRARREGTVENLTGDS